VVSFGADNLATKNINAIKSKNEAVNVGNESKLTSSQLKNWTIEEKVSTTDWLADDKISGSDKLIEHASENTLATALNDAFKIWKRNEKVVASASITNGKIYLKKIKQVALNRPKSASRILNMLRKKPSHGNFKIPSKRCNGRRNSLNRSSTSPSSIVCR
jgi:hypothetical protein